MSKPVVFVIGATGNVGSATVQALSAKYASRVEIRAGVRNPDKAEKLKSISNVSVVKAEMGSAELQNTLKGVHALFIVSPPVENRAALTIATAEYAKKAGVKHQVVIAAPTTAKMDTILGAQLSEIETAVKGLGVPYTLLGLPFFYENHFGFKDTIKGASAIYSPVDATKSFGQVAVADIGNAAAAILADPAPHTNKHYDIVSSCPSYNDLAAALGEALGEKITYNRVPYEDAKKSFLEMGLPQWQIDGMIMQYKLTDAGDPAAITTIVGDYQKITGEQPTSLKAWVAQVKGAFE